MGDYRNLALHETIIAAVATNATTKKEQYQIENNILTSTLHYCKLVFIFGKIVVTVYMLLLAILARLRKFGQYEQISIQMTVNIILLCAVMAFDLGTKYIFGFYLLVFFSNFINFLGLNYLVRKLRTPERKLLRKRTNLYFLIMNILYMVCFVMTLTNEYGPWCTPTQLYPPVMNFANVLFIFNAAMHFFMHSQGYWLKWEENPKIKEILGRETELGWEPIDQLKPLFKK